MKANRPHALHTLSFALSLALAFPWTALAADLALVGGKLYPSPEAAPIEDAVVVVHDGTIAAVGKRGAVAVPKGAQTLDCTGKVIVAGFWNSHVHLTEPVWNDPAHTPVATLDAHMKEMLTGRGFTTVFDLGSSPDSSQELQRMIGKGKLAGPRIYLAGDIFPKDGKPVYLPKELQVPEAATPAEATAMAKRYLAMGEDGIKLFTGAIKGHGVVVPMPVEIVGAAVEVAHAAGKPVFAHPTNRTGVDNALAGGVDVLAHTVPSERGYSEEELAIFRKRHTAMTPTLALFPDEVRKEGEDAAAQEAFVGRAIEELRAFRAAGGTVLFGTDVGYTQLYDTTSEFRYMARAGMTFRDVLASLTATPTRFFKAPHTGTVEKGMDGDLVVLAADPAQDVAAFAQVAATVRGGAVIFRSERSDRK